MPTGLVSVLQGVADTLAFPIQTCSNVAAVLRTPNSSGGQPHSLDVFTSSSMLARGKRVPIVVGWTMPRSHRRLHSLAECAAEAIV